MMPEINKLEEQLIDALTSGDDAALAELGLEMARSAELDFPAFHRALNMLGYHNRLALIVEMMRGAWPHIQESDEYSKSAVEAYAARATDHLIFLYLSDGNGTAPGYGELVERLEAYFAVDEEQLRSYLRLLQGEVGRPWTRPDFEQLEMAKVSALTVEFLGYAHRQEAATFGRAHLARVHLPRYLLDRQAGNLYAKEDMAAVLKGKRPPLPNREREPQHNLVPDRLTLETYLRRMLQTVNALPYAAAATLELAPAWIHFLLSRGLVAEETSRQAVGDLQGIDEALSGYWQDHPDPALRPD